jgi:photosystem II stability/assembly factor-like uncharacterized protein
LARFKSPFVWAFALALILAAAVSVRVGTRDERVASTCTAYAAKKAEPARGRGERAKRPASQVSGLFAGPRGNDALEKCDRPGHPETFEDLAKANSSLMTRQVAPGTQIKPGAQRAAVRQAKDLPTIGNAWAPLGKTPLIANRTDYDQTMGSTLEGFVGLSGRTSAFTRDPGSGAIYAAVSNGGVWKTIDGGGSWSSIGEGLPTQVVSGVARSSVDGGTLLVLTGDRAFGGDTYAGLGVYRSTDEGKTWKHSSGVPDGLLGFRIVVDPNNPKLVYAATGGGLYRSADGGASFVNVNLPTGKNHPAGTPDCSGQAPTVKDCFLANMVTDVVVQGPANANTKGDVNAKPGAVLAAVGWRAGTKKNADNSVQSPGNGVYRSDTGAPGTFTNLDMANNNTPQTGDSLTQGKIGRIALGGATGPLQDHRYVYALIMDAAKFNGGFTGEALDAPNPAASDYLNGIWVSRDFGKTWNELEGSNAMDQDPTSNSALAPPVCKSPNIGYCPGIQAWYNLWAQPDPTEQTASGVPTRLAFGLEEVWANPSPDPTGLDGSTPKKFEVIGRYYGNKTCTPLIISNSSPVCPAASGGTPPPTTTHPDQHAGLWVPDGGSGGGVTLIVGNDGGVYKQHAASGEALDNTKWGAGNNNGLHTLQPYDAEMAKDGTVYMGLQDNGEGKIDPNGDSYTIYGGDGFFTAVDPDNSNTAYEEYVQGVMSVTTDGGKNWNDITPNALTSAQFSTPFQMDPANARHLMIGGRDVEETMDGPDTNNSSWTKVFDLGTQKHPGEAGAASASDDPDNQLSAVDLHSFPRPSGAGTGPPTPDSTFSGGGDTNPDPVGSVLGDGTDLAPGSYDDHPFTIGPNDGDASVTVSVTWKSDTNDWDLFLYTKDANGNLHPAGSSANGSTTEEHVTIENPTPGDYVARVANFQAADTYDGKVTFAAPPPGGTAHGPPTAAYVGFCGFCDTITQGTPFANGLATNVSASGPGEAVDPSGWHIAKAAGLPSRYITSVQMDPSDPRTVYATLAGYGRRWAFPGAVGEDTSKVGKGHVFKSTDGGQTFNDVTGDLPDAPANWTVLHNGHLVVGTDIGVFESCDASGGSYSRLGSGLPAVPISTLRLKPGDPDLLVAATYGRGVYTYRFGDDNGRCAPKPGSPGFPGNGGGGPKVCAAAHGFKSARVVPSGRGLRFVVRRQVKSKYTASIFRTATLGRTTRAKTVARFKPHNGSFTWHGSRKLGAGYYVAQVRVRSGKTFDLRRFPVLLRRGKFHRLRGYWGRASCKLLGIVRLSGPAFGGRSHTSLLISFRTVRSGRAVVTVRRGSHVVKRYKPSWKGARTVRLRLRSLHLRPGTYSVTVSARAGKSRQTVKLYSRRI